MRGPRYRSRHKVRYQWHRQHSGPRGLPPLVYGTFELTYVDGYLVTRLAPGWMPRRVGRPQLEISPAAVRVVEREVAKAANDEPSLRRVAQSNGRPKSVDQKLLATFDRLNVQLVRRRKLRMAVVAAFWNISERAVRRSISRAEKRQVNPTL
jgi:hypothetical protein